MEAAQRINHGRALLLVRAARKTLAPIIDDAHLIDVRDLRRLRLLFEDFTAR